VNGAMFGVVARERFFFCPNCKLRTAPRTGRVHSTTDHAIYLYSPPPAKGACEGGRTVKNEKNGANQLPADGRSETNADPE